MTSQARDDESQDTATIPGPPVDLDEIEARRSRRRVFPTSDLEGYVPALVAEVRRLRDENRNLRESAETAVFAANNITESYQIEKERREDANLHLSAALAERDALRAKVAAVRALHQPVACNCGGCEAEGSCCEQCYGHWPCDTHLALAAVDGSSGSAVTD